MHLAFEWGVTPSLTFRQLLTNITSNAEVVHFDFEKGKYGVELEFVKLSNHSLVIESS